MSEHDGYVSFLVGPKTCDETKAVANAIEMPVRCKGCDEIHEPEPLKSGTGGAVPEAPTSGADVMKPCWHCGLSVLHGDHIARCPSVLAVEQRRKGGYSEPDSGSELPKPAAKCNTCGAGIDTDQHRQVCPDGPKEPPADKCAECGYEYGEHGPFCSQRVPSEQRKVDGVMYGPATTDPPTPPPAPPRASEAARHCDQCNRSCYDEDHIRLCPSPLAVKQRKAMGLSEEPEHPELAGPDNLPADPVPTVEACEECHCFAGRHEVGCSKLANPQEKIKKLEETNKAAASQIKVQAEEVNRLNDECRAIEPLRKRIERKNAYIETLEKNSKRLMEISSAINTFSETLQEIVK